MISKSVIDICKNYNISVVAEGVENEKEYNILKENIEVMFSIMRLDQ